MIILFRRLGGLAFGLLVLFHLIAGSAAIGEVSVRTALEDRTKLGQSDKWLVGWPNYIFVGHATVENQLGAVAESADLFRVQLFTNGTLMGTDARPDPLAQ